MNEKNLNTKPNPIHFLIFLLVCFVGIGAIFILWTPRRIILEPTFPEDVYTSYEENSTITWFSGIPGHAGSKTLVWRKQYSIFNSTFSSQEEILVYLDEWLAEEGWMRWEEIGSPCAHLAEGDFLERGKDYIAYVPKGTLRLTKSPAVCLAVWPETQDESSFAVLIATSNN